MKLDQIDALSYQSMLMYSKVCELKNQNSRKMNTRKRYKMSHCKICMLY